MIFHWILQNIFESEKFQALYNFDLRSGTTLTIGVTPQQKLQHPYLLYFMQFNTTFCTQNFVWQILNNEYSINLTYISSRCKSLANLPYFLELFPRANFPHIELSVFSSRNPEMP